MSGGRYKVLQRLTLEFTKDICRDEIKRLLLPAKVFLESLCSWPNHASKMVKIISWFFFYNLLVLEVFHAAYLVKNASNINEAVSVGATVIAVLEALIRLHILLTKKHVLNGILAKIWQNFWPTSAIIDPKIRRKIRKLALVPFVFLATTLTCAYISNVQIIAVPFIRDHQLILKSIFPFNWGNMYIYELLYTWQYFLAWYALLTIHGFDIFFASLVTICSAQFVILQEMTRSTLLEGSKRQRSTIFGDRLGNMSDKEMLFQCAKQHQLLIGICDDMEASLNKAILIQFVVSTNANCAGFLIMKIDYSQFSKMLFYAGAHLGQLFYYCYVGQQLSYESGQLTDAIYLCDWHLGYDRTFRKALTLMMQRSQRRIRLTAVGLLELDFSSFVKILRLSFSFYTLLDSINDR